MKLNSNNKGAVSFTLSDWMIGLLALKNNDLLIYALVYSFSSRSNGVYNGGVNYLCNRANVSKTTAIHCLQRLTEGGYLIKNSIMKNGVEYNEYRHSPEKLKELGVEKLMNNLSNGKKNQFILIYDWMITQFGLSAHSLLIFAMIHSFTTYNGYFIGNNEYIAKRLNMSSKQVKRIIDKLVDMGLLILVEPYNKNTKKTVYKTIFIESNIAQEAAQNNSDNSETSPSDTSEKSISERGEILDDEAMLDIEQKQEKLVEYMDNISSDGDVYSVIEVIVREEINKVLEDIIRLITNNVMKRLKELGVVNYIMPIQGKRRLY